MPAFGKSGTCRMRVFSASINHSARWGPSAVPHLALSDLEPRHVARGRSIFDVELLDSRGPGPAADRRLESIERLPLPFGRDLDAAVGPVAHPSMDAFPGGSVVSEPAEPDALHAAGNHESARHYHGE